MNTAKRVLVKLQKDNCCPRLADFSECIVNYFGSLNGSINVYIELKDNSVIISNVGDKGQDPAILKHPVFCPIFHLNPAVVSLPEEIRTRGIDAGVTIILESSDGKILLSRRSKHLRIFPGLWVPPGGHIEENETLLEAGLRELKEETGLDIKISQCINEKINLLALWESVYPPKLSTGPPARHHIVVFFHAKLKEDLTANVMESHITFDPVEVDACAWLDKDIISAIAHSFEEEYDDSITNDHLPKSFRGLVLDGNNKQKFSDLPTEPLVRVILENEEDRERVSTGTKYALQRLLQMQSNLL